MRQMPWSDFFYKMSIPSLTQLILQPRLCPCTIGPLHSGSLSEVLVAHSYCIVTKESPGGMAWKIAWKYNLANYTFLWLLSLLGHIIKYGSVKFNFEHCSFCYPLNSVRFYRSQCLLRGHWGFLNLSNSSVYTIVFFSMHCLLGSW